MTRGSPTITAKDRDRFVIALAESANVTKACQEAGISRDAAYEWRNKDEGFAAAWAAAVDRGSDALEDEAVRRAHEGTQKPVFQGGKLVGHVQEYSDTLLIFMLKARRPERFKDRVANEHSGPGGGPVTSIAITATDPVEAAREYQRIMRDE